jgi:hypothetical protein
MEPLNKQPERVEKRPSVIAPENSIPASHIQESVVQESVAQRPVALESSPLKKFPLELLQRIFEYLFTSSAACFNLSCL